ncbi:sigma-54-dependent Fis family transcriptional regulator [Wenzhouxiangella sp. AB-CW3]|uniref:sigma-54-dependent transcriptional regulator n=1 Tax=Wenzhouxiangella sp. AB-CW3 TaxID=2771012 RepID=UPI00168ABA55|nr:sigma-54 dependent transcriptional regulator [Wenzhouxiangella sp. AB-CW3]QOC23657.1 sigma-54-dependent Fis family transcriptional regulator [Wenzhouxiangella sp. AB-CW3]
MTEMRALVVDDEPDLRELLDITLSRMGLEVDTAENLAEARHYLSANADYALCLTDMRLPDGNGLTLIKEINRDHDQLPVAMITAYGKVEDAVTALKYGAFDFVSKPVDLEVLRNMVRTALKLRREDLEAPSRPKAAREDADKDAVDKTASSSAQNELMSKLVGRSQAMERVRQTIRKLARSQAPVLISGESGTGKELAARLIHDLGPRAEEPFLAVNCGAIPSELMESEFFGHIKGSFTGADADKQGLFQAADGGTLFLDEVADLPLAMQVKLLRVIQEKSVRPVGGREEKKIDVRILSASHKPLKPLVENGEFRNDLYYRLNVIELPMPSLRDRRGDIRLLAEHFLQSIGEQWGEPPRQLSRDAMDALQQHRFSGNVRELVNILQRAVTLCEGDEISVEDLDLDKSVLPEDGIDVKPPEDRSLDDYIEDIERRILENALREAKYNKTEAARQLGISFRSLRYKLKKYDID